MEVGVCNPLSNLCCCAGESKVGCDDVAETTSSSFLNLELKLELEFGNFASHKIEHGLSILCDL